MTNVLVCVKRSPDTTGEVLLTEDGAGLDGRYSGYAMSEHELVAVELAASIAEAGKGAATVLTLGEAAALEQLRYALSVGATDAVHIEADAATFGPADTARAIADVVTARDAAGAPYDLVLLGNDAADTGNFQVGIRLAYALGWPVVAGVQRLEVTSGVAHMQVESAEGAETYEVALPAVATVLEGGALPRFPSLRGRMRARKAPVDTRAPGVDPSGTGALGLRVPPPEAREVTVLGEGPSAAPAIVEVLRETGVVP